MEIQRGRLEPDEGQRYGNQSCLITFAKVQQDQSLKDALGRKFAEADFCDVICLDFVPC